MANLIIIVDPNPERKQTFINTVKPLLPPFPGLVTNSCMAGDFASLWAANPKAPISYCSNNRGAAVVWGHAIAHDSTKLMNADSLQKQWAPRNNNSPYPTFDGFYSSVVYDPEYGLIVGADLLGFFPIYYYSDSQIILIGSSPELFRHHPNFNTAFNPQGLVGILLLRHSVDNQTLWSNAKRLGAGNILQWKTETGAKELEHYRFPCYRNQTPYSQLSFSEHLDILDEIIDQAISRHTVTSKKHGFLLSGGLDSRMLAGFIQRQGIEPIAFTFGKPGDIELECAAAVARQLGCEQRVLSVPMNQYPIYANFVANWEHLVGTFGANTGMLSDAYSDLPDSAGTMINGFSMDRVVGGWKNSSFSFQESFNQENVRGISPDLLSRLLKPQIFGFLVLDTIEILRNKYESYAELDWQKPWCFSLFNDNRLVLGIRAWEVSFGAWPILAILDRKLLDTVIGLPPSTMNKRRAQKRLVCTRFPELAQLPLDRNSWNMKPLVSSSTRKPLSSLSKWQENWRRLQVKLGDERRYYYRTFDINNAGWQAVRREAEHYRSKLEYLFNMDTLNELLPPPDVKLKFKSDPIQESSKVKILLGLLLWSKNNL